MCIDIHVNMDSCIHVTHCCCELSILKCTITVVFVCLFLGSCDSWDTSKSALVPDSRRDSSHNLFHAGTLRCLRLEEGLSSNWRGQNTSLHPGHSMGTFELGSGGFDN